MCPFINNPAIVCNGKFFRFGVFFILVEFEEWAKIRFVLLIMFEIKSKFPAKWFIAFTSFVRVGGPILV